MASYAENIRGNMDVLREKGVDFIQPFLPMDDPKRMAERLYEELGRREGLTRKEIKAACEAGYKELAHYREDVREYGRKILARLEQTGEQAIVLAGRPYHIDPEINHGIPELITSYGIAVLSEDSISHLGNVERPLIVSDQWMYHSRLYGAANYAKKNKQLEVIQLNSFGCGLDAVTTDAVNDILRRSG